MAAKKMTVRDAYAKVKKQGQGGTLNKGSKRAQQVKGEAKSQNPSSRNKVGVKSKNKKGPWDDIVRGVVKGAKIGGAVAKEVTKPARDPIGAAVGTLKGVRKDVKDKNIKGLAIQALGVVPAGRIGKVAATGAKAGKAASKAAKTTSKVSDALEAANKELAAVRAAKTAFKGPKAGGGKVSAGWAELLKKERNAQYKVNTAMKSEQRAGKAAENLKKVGVEKPKTRDKSLGSTTASKKGDERIPLPENTKAYSRIPKNTKDTANAPLEKNQRYAYEADEMRRVEGKDRFLKREERRMDRSAKNKERQAKTDIRNKEARIKANWKEVKAKAANGGPKAKARAERMKKFWADQGIKLD